MIFEPFGAQRAANVLKYSFSLIGAATLAHASPLASNNGMYPEPAKEPAAELSPTQYAGRYNVSNLDYPTVKPTPDWTWEGGPLNSDNALQYMEELKAHIGPSISILVQDSQNWDAAEHNWYNMVWRGAGVPGDPTKGREVIMNTNTGQIVPSSGWGEGRRPTTEYVQNFGVIYYNETAAFMLGQVWSDLYRPNIGAMLFPEGSIVVKVEAATVQPDQWPWNDPAAIDGSVLGGAPEWNVFRPTTEDQKKHQNDPVKYPVSFLKNQVQTVRPFQLAIKVKDTAASPITGWVYLGYVYDARQRDKEQTWDRFIPAGLMWGNDPDYANSFNGEPPEGESLKETWVNPAAPDFVTDTLGWGGRFAAPMDVAVRHRVVLPDGSRPPEGFQASSCLSCHGAAQFPFVENIYPSPIVALPPDGDVSLPMFYPGSAKWQQWFQNRDGGTAQSQQFGTQSLDYDLSTMLALGIWAGTTGQVGLGFETLDGH